MGYRAARLKGGAISSAAASAAPSPSQPSDLERVLRGILEPKAPQRTIKVNAVMDQVSEEAVPILDDSAIKEHYIAYEAIFKRMPPEGKECTSEQLSGLHSRIARGAV
eukprot:15382303-Heterocapsa_arctica.AAC.1